MSIRNKNAMNQVKTPAQNVSGTGKVQLVSGGKVVKGKGTASRAHEVRNARPSIGLSKAYSHTTANAHFIGASAKRKI